MADKRDSNSEPQANGDKPRAGVDMALLLPALAFVLIVGVAGTMYFRHAAGVRAEQRALDAQVQEAGLPRGYPLRLVPLKDDFIIRETERGSAVSTDGRPMDSWTVLGEAPQPYDEVFTYYKEHLLGAGMGQTQFISVPNSYYVEYGDAQGTVSFEIDAERGDDGGTRVKIQINRLR